MILLVFWTIPSVLNIMPMVKLFNMNLNQMAKVSLLLKKIKKSMSGKHFCVLKLENNFDVLNSSLQNHVFIAVKWNNFKATVSYFLQVCRSVMRQRKGLHPKPSCGISRWNWKIKITALLFWGEFRSDIIADKVLPCIWPTRV